MKLDKSAEKTMTQNKGIPTPAIEFRNVYLSFNDTPALADISFRLERGEMAILTGVSGSGKSVLLRLAIGLLKPDSGEILIDGREIEMLDETELLAIRGGLMGMVFQEDSLFTGLTVYDNVAYRPAEHGWDDERIQKAVSEVLQFVGLEGEENKFPEELSGGMKRRLEIARALIGWPKIMLYDEPTMSLDPIMAIQVLDLIIRARDVNNISSLYVTKKIYEIAHLAKLRASQTESGEVIITEAPPDRLPRTKVIVLDQGRIAFSGTVEEFHNSDLPAITEIVTFDNHDHSKEPHFINPWDKRRQPTDKLL